MKESNLARRRDVEAGSPALFQDCVVMPSQFFTHQRRVALHGERRLLLAVIEEAIDSFCRTACAADGASRKLHREAEEWLFSDDRSWYVAFANACDVLDIDCECLRARLRRWEHEQLRRKATARTLRLA